MDTSVWIGYFNGQQSEATEELDDLLSSTLMAVGDLILTEVLQGFRNDTDYRTAKSLYLRSLPGLSRWGTKNQSLMGDNRMKSQVGRAQDVPDMHHCKLGKRRATLRFCPTYLATWLGFLF